MLIGLCVTNVNLINIDNYVGFVNDGKIKDGCWYAFKLWSICVLEHYNLPP